MEGRKILLKVRKYVIYLKKNKITSGLVINEIVVTIDVMGIKAASVRVVFWFYAIPR